MSEKVELDGSDTSEDASIDAVDVAEKGGETPRLERGMRVHFKVGMMKSRRHARSWCKLTRPRTVSPLQRLPLRQLRCSCGLVSCGLVTSHIISGHIVCGPRPQYESSPRAQNLVYDVHTRGRGRARLRVLRHVTGFLNPAEMTAVLGVSGAGKSTLLDCLAGRKPCGTDQSLH